MPNVSAHDRGVLRDLARQVADIAALPVQAQRRELWERHNALEPCRPMMLIFPEGSWQELLPPPALACEGADARGIEQSLRMRIYYHEHLRDDTVIENEWVVGKVIRNTGLGIEPRRIPSPDARGAWHFDPVIRQPSDLKKIRIPEIAYDEKATELAVAQANDWFGDILTVRLKGIAHRSFHLMNRYTALRGLEEVMVDMYAEPAMLHEAMAILTDAYENETRQYVEQNLLSVNHDGTYHSSGGNGYTRELPKPGFQPDRVRPCDMWASAEAQEMALVSPEQHAEFVLQYEKRLLAPFGLNGYGCCEDLTRKLDPVFTIPNIRRVSIAPRADVDICAGKLQGKCIFSWKPEPAHLVGRFDEAALHRYLRHTLDAARRHGCVLEMILKDTHTCEQRPEIFDRWSIVAREEIERTAA